MKSNLFIALFLSLMIASGCGNDAGVVVGKAAVVAEAELNTPVDDIPENTSGASPSSPTGNEAVATSDPVAASTSNAGDTPDVGSTSDAGDTPDVASTSDAGDTSDVGSTSDAVSQAASPSGGASATLGVNDDSSVEQSHLEADSDLNEQVEDVDSLASDSAPLQEPPDNDYEPAGNIQSPEAVKAVRYSANAGELFWVAASDADSSTRYVIKRDGEVLDTVSTQSYFTETLKASKAHRFSVIATDGQGGVSKAAEVTINDQIDVPPPVYEFELSVDRSRAALDEGNNEGTSFVIKIDPKGLETVALDVQAQTPADGANVKVSLGESSLSHEQRQTSVTFKFPVGMQPISEQSRRFNVVATSGEIVRIAEIILDVKPIKAPDVYLLIGQSNMIGSSLTGAKEVYPGGADERNSRIWQLNVTPNNRSLFASEADFLNESNNAIEPRFIEAEDPLHDPRNPVVSFKGGTTVGPGLSFAKAALAGTTQRIYLVPAAWGATGFCQSLNKVLGWNAKASNNASLAGTALLDRALVRLRMTLRDTGGVLRGILWHQGGADSNKQACADVYEQNLRLMIERLRTEAPVDARGPQARGPQAPIPFIVGTQSKGRDSRGNYASWPWTKSKVDGVQRNIASVVPYADWVNNDDLIPPAYPCGSTSCVHFGATANREIGNRFYQALQRIWSR